jgi:hypothetical protein
MASYTSELLVFSGIWILKRGCSTVTKIEERQKPSKLENHTQIPARKAHC